MSGSRYVRVVQGVENTLLITDITGNLLDLLPRLASEISTKQMKIGSKSSILMMEINFRFDEIKFTVDAMNTHSLETQGSFDRIILTISNMSQKLLNPSLNWPRRV